MMPLQVSRVATALRTRPSGSSPNTSAISLHSRPKPAAVRAPIRRGDSSGAGQKGPPPAIRPHKPRRGRPPRRPPPPGPYGTPSGRAGRGGGGGVGRLFRRVWEFGDQRKLGRGFARYRGLFVVGYRLIRD